MYDYRFISCCGCYSALLQLWWLFDYFLYGGPCNTAEHKYAYLKIKVERPCKDPFYFIHSFSYSNPYIINCEIAPWILSGNNSSTALRKKPRLKFLSCGSSPFSLLTSRHHASVSPYPSSFMQTGCWKITSPLSMILFLK